MNTTFATLIHSAPKLDIKELIEVRKQLSAVLDDKFVKECDYNYDLINPVVSAALAFFFTFVSQIIGRTDGWVVDHDIFTNFGFLGRSKHRLQAARGRRGYLAYGQFSEGAEHRILAIA